jgi:DNA-binding transcriptional MerR regulator
MEGIEDNQGIDGNGHSEPAIADKNLFRIGEVSRLTATKPFVLRYWETEFPMLQPVKSPKGHRLYRQEDIDTVFTIKRLLYDEGFTIAGARRHLRDQALGGDGTSGDAVSIQPESHNGEAATSAPQAMSTQPFASQPMSSQLAMLNRQTLLDLRDSLRSLLTVLESE